MFLEKEALRLKEVSLGGKKSWWSGRTQAIEWEPRDEGKDIKIMSEKSSCYSIALFFASLPSHPPAHYLLLANAVPSCP